ncbi:MAG TPA: DNA-binding protein [Thermodesulfobacteriota bacterium]|nr:DNA-binding protein [Thermodesulfobacteriota bacterium]
MKYSTARQGRTFIMRFEDGDIVHEEIERLAQQEAISSAAIIIVGGADNGSKLVVGPKDGAASPGVPLYHVLSAVHEVAGVGTLFPDEEGKPLLHLHMACGREESAVTGCIRTGVRVWKIMEAVLIELVDTTGKRVFDLETGFKLLVP